MHCNLVACLKAYTATPRRPRKARKIDASNAAEQKPSPPKKTETRLLLDSASLCLCFETMVQPLPERPNLESNQHMEEVDVALSGPQAARSGWTNRAKALLAKTRESKADPKSQVPKPAPPMMRCHWVHVGFMNHQSMVCSWLPLEAEHDQQQDRMTLRVPEPLPACYRGFEYFKTFLDVSVPWTCTVYKCYNVPSQFLVPSETKPNVLEVCRHLVVPVQHFWKGQAAEDAARLAAGTRPPRGPGSGGHPSKPPKRKRLEEDEGQFEDEADLDEANAENIGLEQAILDAIKADEDALAASSIASEDVPPHDLHADLDELLNDRAADLAAEQNEAVETVEAQELRLAGDTALRDDRDEHGPESANRGRSSSKDGRSSSSSSTSSSSGARVRRAAAAAALAGRVVPNRAPDAAPAPVHDPEAGHAEPHAPDDDLPPLPAGAERIRIPGCGYLVHYPLDENIVAVCPLHTDCKKKRTLKSGNRAGQGRCLGFLVSWLQSGSEYRDQKHHVNGFATTLPKRQRARQDFMQLPNADHWGTKERPKASEEPDEPVRFV